MSLKPLQASDFLLWHFVKALPVDRAYLDFPRVSTMFCLLGNAAPSLAFSLLHPINGTIADASGFHSQSLTENSHESPRMSQRS